MALPRDPLPASVTTPNYSQTSVATTSPTTVTDAQLQQTLQQAINDKNAEISQYPDFFTSQRQELIADAQQVQYDVTAAAAADQINQAIGTAYPDAIVPTGLTVPGTPSVTATNTDLTTPPREDVIQSESAYFSLDNAMFSGALDSVSQQAIIVNYENAVQAISPIGNSLGGAASAIVGTANAVTNTLTSTVNSVVGAITDVLSGKILTDAVSGLMSTAEKFVAMVGQAAYQNVMGFLESFKMVENIFNSACNIASDIGQTVKKAAADIKSVLSADWDKLSWPDINWDRIKSCFDTETFSKIGQSIGNFLGNTKLPIGLSLNQISDLTKNLDVKEQLLKQVEDVKSGVTKLGTQALESLYAQVAAVNNAILAITNLPNSLTSMFNGLVNRLDPLKERAANKVIMDYIKKGKVVKDEVVEEFNEITARGNERSKYFAQRIAENEGFPDYKSWDGLGSQSRLAYFESLPADKRDTFIEYIKQNPRLASQGLTGSNFQAP